MNCIFICVFNNEKYVDLFLLLLESIYIFGKLNDDTELLIYTTRKFIKLIMKNYIYKIFKKKIKFEINDNYNDIKNACRSRYDFFNLEMSQK